MTDKLLKLLEFVEKIPSIVVVLAMFYAYHWFTTQDKVPIIKTDKVTVSELDKNSVSSDPRDLVEIMDGVEDARTGKVNASITLPPDATQEMVDRAVDSLGGDKAVSEPSDKPGTNIYSIQIRRAPHGVGVYGNIKMDNGNIDYGYGLHYRNKRIVYQAGVDHAGRFEGRVAYELIQW